MTQAYETQRAIDNLAEDVSACVAFYTVSIIFADSTAEKLNSKTWADTAAAYRPTLENALALLRVTMAGKPEKFMKSKIDLRMQEQTKILEGEGIDRLFVLHSNSCKALMENTDQRFKYWTEKQ